jgi:transposase
MGKTKIIQLTDEQRGALEKGYKTGKTHSFRQRCQMILLKSERKRTSAEISRILGCCEVVVNRWIDRFEAEDVKGLETRLGRGRKPKLSMQNPQHVRKVEREIARNPQSLKTVVARLAEELDLQMHPDTLKRFLKKTVTASAAVGQASSQGRWLLIEKPEKSN